MSGPKITQIVIFHPDVGQSTAPQHRARDKDEQTADRQRYINLELERIQVDEKGEVLMLVVGTNNYVYALIDYPVEESEPKLKKADPAA
jgi:hypothetical protein